MSAKPRAASISGLRSGWPAVSAPLRQIKKPVAAEMGGKGFALAVLARRGYRVPDGFVVGSSTFLDILQRQGDLGRVRALIAGLEMGNIEETKRALSALLGSMTIPVELQEALLGPIVRLRSLVVSVRSSAVGEDSEGASFAGIHDTYIRVPANPRSVLRRVRSCWASLVGERALAYRILRGIVKLDGMAVVVQRMIDASISGVVFTRRTADGSELLVEAVPGPGQALVSGETTPDRYLLDRRSRDVVESIAARGEPLLSHARLSEIASTALSIERLFRTAQDIEWCIDEEGLWILQSRPITEFLAVKAPMSKTCHLLAGTGASPGIGRGRVSVILDRRNIGRVSSRRILVTAMTSPLYMAAIHRAAAIVTDRGGMTCHAAIVARELGIPCVVGTGEATRVLKDGMNVVVDGTKGTVDVLP